MRDAPTGPREDHTRRNRSRSPRRDRRGGGGGGFRWKEKRRDDDRNKEGRERRLERGYRNRSPRRDRRDDRDGGDRRDGGRDGGDKGDRREGEKDRARREKRERIVEPNISKKEDSLDLASKFGPSSTSNSNTNSTSKPNPAPPQQQSAAPQERMITVFVNDRLGTRAQIPCLASDNIKLFKMQVAAQIGRQPHEILLKRQGERPFKDMLTLEDYGVSNGVQLDLEIDTGE